MQVGIFGSGDVAKSLGAGFLTHGHTVMLGTRTAGKLGDWLKQNPKGRAGSFAETARFADLGVLAVKGSASAEAVRLTDGHLDGKVVIDATNPIADTPPVDGVLPFFTSYSESLMERLQREFARVRFVKAFNSVGAARMVNPQFKAGRPTMFICGDDDAAKSVVRGVLDAFGWDTADMGRAIAARAVEPLCILWCIPGFRDNQWTHAFKLLIN